MEEKEKKFHDKVGKNIDILINDYRDRFKRDRTLYGMRDDFNTYSDLIRASSELIAKIANEIYNDTEKDTAIKLANEKMRSILPKAKELMGL
jgi:hypothetical protein